MSDILMKVGPNCLIAASNIHMVIDRNERNMTLRKMVAKARDEGKIIRALVTGKGVLRIKSYIFTKFEGWVILSPFDSSELREIYNKQVRQINGKGVING